MWLQKHLGTWKGVNMFTLVPPPHTDTPHPLYRQFEQLSFKRIGRQLIWPGDFPKICQTWATQLFPHRHPQRLSTLDLQTLGNTNKWKWCLNQVRKLSKAALAKVSRIKLAGWNQTINKNQKPNTISTSCFKKRGWSRDSWVAEKKEVPSGKADTISSFY